jgi:hypothetical protein
MVAEAETSLCAASGCSWPGTVHIHLTRLLALNPIRTKLMHLFFDIVGLAGVPQFSLCIRMMLQRTSQAALSRQLRSQAGTQGREHKATFLLSLSICSL